MIVFCSRVGSGGMNSSFETGSTSIGKRSVSDSSIKALKRFGIFALPVLPLWYLVAIRSPTLSTGRPPKRRTPRPPPREPPAAPGVTPLDVPRRIDRDRNHPDERHPTM